MGLLTADAVMSIASPEANTSTMPTTASIVQEGKDERRRVEDNSVSGGIVNLAEDCLLFILTFLQSKDLNSIAMCSRRCREARRDPSLDQTRTGTILWSKRTSILQLYDAISDGGWTTAFSGNRTRLRVLGLEGASVHQTPANVERRARSDDVRLAGVISLDLSCSPPPPEHSVVVGDSPYYALALILPNLKEVDLSYRESPLINSAIETFCRHCPHLTRFTWKCCSAEVGLNGYRFKDAVNLTELYMDDCISWEDEPIRGRENWYMWSYCKRLERLSIKNLTLHSGDLSNPLIIQPVSQGALIKFVRHTPTLRWLRSDLTEENVAILQQERPDITFVTE